MRKFMQMELKRAFGSVSFWAVFSIAISICVWHFMENVIVLRNYIYLVSYPLSTFGKWIGGENFSLQPTLYYLVIPILCAIPYGSSYYFDVKSGFIEQLITRGEKRNYLEAKFAVTFLSGAVTSGVPLIVDFLLTGIVLPTIIPQSGLGLFPITDKSLMGNLFYTQPYLYLLLYLLMDMVFFGLINMIAIWAVSFVNNGFWIVLMPFLSYMFLFCVMQFVNQPRFAPIAFLRPSQPLRSAWSAIFFELLILLILNIFFFLWYQKRECINHE